MAKSTAQVVESLKTIRDSLITELETETTYRAAHGAKPSYSVNGKSVDWNAYLRTMREEIAEYTKQINSMSWSGGPVDSYMRS